MSIHVDDRRCNGCGRCRQICPGQLFTVGEGNRTCLRYPEDCWGCAACLKACPTGALRYQLGSAPEERSRYLTARELPGKIEWLIVSGAKVRRFIVDKSSTNAY